MAWIDCEAVSVYLINILCRALPCNNVARQRMCSPEIKAQLADMNITNNQNGHQKKHSLQIFTCYKFHKL